MQRPGHCPGLSLFMQVRGLLAGASDKHPIRPAKDGAQTEPRPAILEIDHGGTLQFKQETEGVGHGRLCDQGLDLPKRGM